MNKHRLGFFTLNSSSLDRWESELLPIMGNFVIVESRCRHDLMAIEFLAYSPLFDEVERYKSAPHYELEIAYFPHAPVVIKAIRKS